MIFIVTLNQELFCQIPVEADTKEEAVRAACEEGRRNRDIWTPLCDPLVSDVEEDEPDPVLEKMTDEEIDDLDSLLTDMSIDFVLGEDWEGEEDETVPSTEKA